MSGEPCDVASLGYDASSSGDATPIGIAPYELGHLQSFVKAAIATGSYRLQLTEEGEGGTYFIAPKNGCGAPIAVFKPSEEEIGCQRNPRGNTTSGRQEFAPGEGYKREVLAYQLDHCHFAKVPETVEIEIGGRVGSVQRFIPSICAAADTMPRKHSVEAVQRIAIFDIRTLNSDRHGGNLLVPSGDATSLFPIDHSYILPEGYADLENLEWMDWEQAKLPLGLSELQYIAGLNPAADQALVTNALGAESGDIIWLTTTLLQIAAANGYTLNEMASFCRRPTLTQPSALESLIAECRLDLDLGGAIDLTKAEATLRGHFGAR